MTIYWPESLSGLSLGLQALDLDAKCISLYLYKKFIRDVTLVSKYTCVLARLACSRYADCGLSVSAL